jgi:hypothetical protein
MVVGEKLLEGLAKYQQPLSQSAKTICHNLNWGGPAVYAALPL